MNTTYSPVHVQFLSQEPVKSIGTADIVSSIPIKTEAFQLWKGTRREEMRHKLRKGNKYAGVPHRES